MTKLLIFLLGSILGYKICKYIDNCYMVNKFTRYEATNCQRQLIFQRDK